MQAIALINFDEHLNDLISKCDFRQRHLVNFTDETELISNWDNKQFEIVAIISNSEMLGSNGIGMVESLSAKKLPRIPIFLLVTHFNKNLLSVALDAGIVDVFELPFVTENVEKRVNFTINNWEALQQKFQKKTSTPYKTPFGKRLFDIVFSGLALLFFSPIFLIIYILVKIESPGPAFYYSYRAGTGYRIFKFYKFRSMYINADQRLKDLKHLNQYEADAVDEVEETKYELNLCSDCVSYGACQFPLYADNTTWCEKQYMTSKKTNAKSAFIKIKNDPRVTKIGNFIRNASIDELPQLWNVFIGNMSIVGNRPLPLYEAEKLTVDKYALRFIAPAGITGLWQVEKRGKGDMNEDERLMLDNSYALNHSFKNDLLVILKTVPALLQKENV